MIGDELTQINYLPNIDGKSTKIEFRNKVEIAIMRLREFAKPNEPYFFADSFGKDSCVTRDLLRLSGKPYETYYNQTGIDPPELVKFGRGYHPEAIWIKPKMSLFKALAEKEGFPTRTKRWCCDLLKEQSGKGRIVVTGIRWQESPSRRGNRRMFEVCNKDKTTFYLNPIIDWTYREVWEYIHSNHIPYCPLYDEKGNDGKPLFKRLGCVLCPMGSAKQAQIQLERFPKLAEAWHRAFIRFYELTPRESVHKDWADADVLWQWWLSRKGEPKVNDAQCVMFDN